MFLSAPTTSLETCFHFNDYKRFLQQKPASIFDAEAQIAHQRGPCSEKEKNELRCLVLSSTPTLLKKMPDANQEMQLLAVQKNGTLLAHLPGADAEVIKAALTQDPNAARFLDKGHIDLLLQILMDDAIVIHCKYMLVYWLPTKYKNNPNVMLPLIVKWPVVVSWAGSQVVNNLCVAKFVAQMYPDGFSCLSDGMRNLVEIARPVVLVRPSLLRFAGPFAIAALYPLVLPLCGSMLQHLPADAKNDPKWINVALSNDESAIQYVDPEHQDYYSFVDAYVPSLVHLPASYAAKKNLVAKIIQKYPNDISLVHPDLQTFDLVRAAVLVDGFALYTAPKSMQKRVELVRLAVQSCFFLIKMPEFFYATSDYETCVRCCAQTTEITNFLNTSVVLELREQGRAYAALLRLMCASARPSVFALGTKKTKTVQDVYKMLPWDEVAGYLGVPFGPLFKVWLKATANLR
jgi:hypothetical protein